MHKRRGASGGPFGSDRCISAFDLFPHGLGDSGSFGLVRHRCPLPGRPLPASDPTHSLWRDLVRGFAHFALESPIGQMWLRDGNQRNRRSAHLRRSGNSLV